MKNSPLKIILLGNTGVGKTCIINRYVNNTFYANLQSTVSADFSRKTLNIKSKEVNIQIWDTAGQERYRSITEAYYRGSSGAIIVFDLTDEDSFHAVETWVQNYKEHSFRDDFANIILAGNKSDFVEKRLVSNQEAIKYANSINVKYVEVSAKTGENIDELFNIFVNDLCDAGIVPDPDPVPTPVPNPNQNCKC